MEKFIRRFSIFLDLLKVKYLGKRVPLSVSWAVSRRCNYRCKYCAIWRTSTEELDTKNICKIIAEMADSGVKKISFTGGEPLLREDIGIIIDYAHQKNIPVNLNSNGSLIRQRISELKKISMLTLSLEGPEEIHDSLRQKGSFKNVIEAMDIALKNNIKVVLSTTLNTLNLNHIEYLLELSRCYNVKIQFQPSVRKILGGEGYNPVSIYSEEYNKIMKRIIDMKRGKHKKIIKNSLAGLIHLSQWPNLKKIKCASGLITCRIEPNGDVLHCERIHRQRINPPLNCIKNGFKNAFYGLPIIFCKDCCCALRVEASYISQLNISTLANAYLHEG